MIFSELYSVYYSTVSKIIDLIISSKASEKEVSQLILTNAFSESAVAIMQAVKEERWQIISADFKTQIKHSPTIPVTLLEKRWLKAVMNDPRIKLFGIDFELDGIEPLFTTEDYKVFDKYGDGDPFEDKEYIERFRLILNAIKSRRPVDVTFYNRHGRRTRKTFIPGGLEYSEKDDKFRVIVSGDEFLRYNIGRFVSCSYYNGSYKASKNCEKDLIREVVLLVEDKRNSLERVLLSFAHFEKSVEKTADEHYILRMKYYEADETEIVIRILSFGSHIKVLEPEPFRSLIIDRLKAQKSCVLR